MENENNFNLSNKKKELENLRKKLTKKLYKYIFTTFFITTAICAIVGLGARDSLIRILDMYPNIIFVVPVIASAMSICVVSFSKLIPMKEQIDNLREEIEFEEEKEEYDKFKNLSKESKQLSNVMEIKNKKENPNMSYDEMLDFYQKTGGVFADNDEVVKSRLNETENKKMTMKEYVKNFEEFIKTNPEEAKQIASEALIATGVLDENGNAKEQIVTSSQYIGKEEKTPTKTLTKPKKNNK